MLSPVTIRPVMAKLELSVMRCVLSVICVVSVLAWQPASATTLQGAVNLEDVDVRLTFDNGDGKRQDIAGREVQLTLSDETANIHRVLCDKKYKVPKQPDFSLFVTTKLTVNTDAKGKLRLSETAECSFFSDREGIECAIVDDGGRYTIQLDGATDDADCPNLILRLPANSTVRLGGVEGEGIDVSIANDRSKAIRIPIELDR
jgi:hypothetical protein